ncbi:uncharacterized protein LOC122439222 isoform X2 [Cervus canadensis]|uniref:uncharacterized protein LOC122439222 isoform X2 n=1 Tax=Cervus canadensis TaxID=1574408 RepID=UPI001C9E862A|nr:uncharacterized protein LOC122439222 isoform X2 [Cervus canadensis]
MGRNLALSFCFCYCSFLPLLGRMVTKPSGFLAGLSLLLDSIFLPTGEARQSSGTQTRHSPRVLSQAAAGAQRKVLLRPDLVDPPTACAVRRGNAAGCRRKQAVPEQLLFSVSGWPSGLRRQTQASDYPDSDQGFDGWSLELVPLIHLPWLKDSEAPCKDPHVCNQKAVQPRKPNQRRQICKVLEIFEDKHSGSQW